MRIYVKVKTNSKKETIEKIDDSTFTVRVKEPPFEGKANRAIIKLIAEYFGVPQSRVSIIIGHTSGNKIIEIGD